MTFNYKDYNPSPLLRAFQIFLLLLIIVGIGLIFTRDIWVPKLVDYILSKESPLPEFPVARPGKIDTGVEGIVTIGPSCPVVREDGACKDKPFQTTLIISSNLPGKGGGILVKSGADGYFSQELIPGTYTIRAQSETLLPRFSPITFVVTEHARAALNLKFDSGIR